MYPFVLVCYPYVTRMLLVCIRMYPYVTRMYPYVTRMLLVVLVWSISHDLKTAVIRNIVEIIYFNSVFLIIRAVVYFKYHRDESVFIAKNIISIVLSISCGYSRSL